MTITDLINNASQRRFLFFWRHTEKSGMTTKACLSQWYPSTFKADGITYSSAEQYMMGEKARLMGDGRIY